MPEVEALELIDSVASNPSLDELARRARQTLANPNPSEEDEKVMIEFWRRQRASWGQKQEKDDDDEAGC